MIITLKNVKHNEALSEETHCFSATVYIDGKRVFGIKNSGHGGEDSVYSVDKKSHSEVLDILAGIDKELGKEKCKPPYQDMDNELSFVVGDLVNQFLLDREIKKDLRKVAYLKGGKVYIVNVKSTQENIERVKQQDWWQKEYFILNGQPIEDIREFYSA